MERKTAQKGGKRNARHAAARRAESALNAIQESGSATAAFPRSGMAIDTVAQLPSDQPKAAQRTYPRSGVLTTRKAETATVLQVGRAMDIYGAPAQREEIANVAHTGCIRLIVDLTDMPFMDSTGMGVLVGGLKKMRTCGGMFLLVLPDEQHPVLKMFRITGLTKVFLVFQSVERAMAFEPRVADGAS